MINAGCEIVRITAPGVEEANNLSIIKNELNKKGYKVPIIADIHFNPKAAETAAQIVEKIRINPGNYVDRNRGKSDYSDIEYQDEINKIKSRLTPLIQICKKHKTAIRIGSNHGSLSDRILHRYGDTPLGMVESAMEFIRICVEQDFFQLVISMKASNVKTMVQANRLLVKRMEEEGFDFPIHLGVTEAGDGEDGRIKSAVGIATLLSEGIGDTIRVSLTEEPEFELPVAKLIAGQFSNNDYPGNINLNRPFSYNRRETKKIGKLGAGQPPLVLISSNEEENVKPLWDESFHPDFIIPKNNKSIIEQAHISLLFISGSCSREETKKAIHKNINSNSVIIIDSQFDEPIYKIREIINYLIEEKVSSPVILRRKFKSLSNDEFTIKAASDYGSLLIDGLLDGIWIESVNQDMETISRVSFGILQATGDRSFKTEYIACPSCGRTLFNIQETLAKIKQRTSYLKGLKIGVMGCIVNGPGEMADAHFGYVGAGTGKVSLYKSNQLILKNIDEDKAVDELIQLIKENDAWQKP
jgi:(E)-4-hydroxy-3-methylbut-2-enyl-diphosphate synthase